MGNPLSSICCNQCSHHSVCKWGCNSGVGMSAWYGFILHTMWAFRMPCMALCCCLRKTYVTLLVRGERDYKHLIYNCKHSTVGTRCWSEQSLTSRLQWPCPEALMPCYVTDWVKALCRFSFSCICCSSCRLLFSSSSYLSIEAGLPFATMSMLFVIVS